MADLKVVASRAVLATQQPQGPRAKTHGHTGFAIDRAQVAIKQRAARHEAQGHARAALGRGVGFGTMNHVDIVHGHFTGLQLQVHSLRFVKGALGHALVQHQIVAVFVQVLVQHMVAV